MKPDTEPRSMFSLRQADRTATLLPRLIELTNHHRRHCGAYARILSALGHAPHRRYEQISELPWLPVRLFKNHELRSVDDASVFKMVTSSGTSGRVSRMYLDRDTAAAQQRTLVAVLRTVLGSGRLPMLLIDSREPLANRHEPSARAAGLLGLMTFGRHHTFLLDRDGRPDPATLRRFLRAYGDRTFLIFGFTFMVWLHLHEVARIERLDLSNGILIHSGGWKNLEDRAVAPTEFRRRFAVDTGLTRVHNFYGMAEQIGSVFLEGPEGGALYCHDESDLIVRDPRTWEESPIGVPGVVEVVSVLPRSYPGHVVLTEDLGVIHGIDDGSWPGKRFSILGRLPRAEARGCSDTYAPDADRRSR
jgi:hypothetical protein